jgi:hypothetical protein
MWHGVTDPISIAAIVADVWTPAGLVVADVCHGPVWRGTSQVVTTVAFRASTHRAAVRLPLDEVAREASRRLKTRALAAFCADHYLLGGFRLYGDGSAIASELSEEAYTAMSRCGVEALVERSLDCSEEDALFFTETIVDATATGHTLVLTRGAAWERRPRLSPAGAVPSAGVWAYVVAYPPDVQVEGMPVARLLAHGGWLETLHGLADDLRSEGLDVVTRHPRS